MYKDAVDKWKGVLDEMATSVGNLLTPRRLI